MTIVISICIFASILVGAMAFGLGYAVGFNTGEPKSNQIGKHAIRDFDKVKRVIESCKNGKQVYTAGKMTRMFFKLYPHHDEYYDELIRLIHLKNNSI